MKTFLTHLFIENWQRKLISLGLAIIIWLSVNHTLTTTRIISNVAVRVVNIPAGKTVEGLQTNGFLTKKITLTLVGNKTLINDLAAGDIEVLVDARDKPDEWIPTITKKDLIATHPDLDLSKGITRIAHSSFAIHMTRLITEKIPIIITKPIGEPPRNYLFLDVWPYHLYTTITGPQAAVEHLKATGLKVTFNLNEISKRQLDQIIAIDDATYKDVVSFPVPEDWKLLHVPTISDTPISIDDPQAKMLHIDFLRCDLLPIKQRIPITLFFSPDTANAFNPKNCHVMETPLIQEHNGLYFLQDALYAKGVSRLFLEIVEEMMQLVIIVNPAPETGALSWSTQFINPRALEDRYVSILLSDPSNDEISHLSPALREEYLRNRFRSYMSKFQLFKADDAKLELNISLEKGAVIIKER